MWELDYKERIDAFELWCWRRLLRVPWIAKRSNQSILKEISPEYLLEGLMFKLKLQYFDHLMQRTDSLEKTLLLGKIEGRRRRVRQRMRWLDGITGQWTWVWINSRSWWWTGRPGMLQSTGSWRVGHDWATELNLLLLEFSVSLATDKSFLTFCTLFQFLPLFLNNLSMLPLFQKRISTWPIGFSPVFIWFLRTVF